MQKVMCLLAARLAKELIIQFLDLRNFVRFSDRCLLIQIIENGSSLCTYINGIAHITGNLRLSAAVYAAAGTCHDLDELLVCLALADLVEQDLCIA